MNMTTSVDFKEKMNREVRFFYGDEALFDDDYMDNLWFSENKAFEEKKLDVANHAKGKYFCIKFSNNDIYGFLFQSIRMRLIKLNMRY